MTCRSGWEAYHFEHQIIILSVFFLPVYSVALFIIYELLHLGVPKFNQRLYIIFLGSLGQSFYVIGLSLHHNQIIRFICVCV